MNYQKEHKKENTMPKWRTTQYPSRTGFICGTKTLTKIGIKKHNPNNLHRVYCRLNRAKTTMFKLAQTTNLKIRPTL